MDDKTTYEMSLSDLKGQKVVEVTVALNRTFDMLTQVKALDQLNQVQLGDEVLKELQTVGDAQVLKLIAELDLPETSEVDSEEKNETSEEEENE